jgi:hypothetical protein
MTRRVIPMEREPLQCKLLQAVGRKAVAMPGASAVFDTQDFYVFAIVLAALAVISVFVYIPLVSDFAFWILFAAFVLLVQYEPPKK